MNKKALNFLSYFALFSAVSLAANATFAAMAPNPRSAGMVAPQRAEGKEVKRTTSAVSMGSEDSVSRSATRRPTTTSARTAANSAVQSVSTGRAAARPAVVSVNRPDTTTARTAVSNGVVRSAAKSPSMARSATNLSTVSRAATSRATAVFDDVSKIGGGYAACRESYSTCMDQFCAKANDTFRRCYCSTKYTDFRETEAALDDAKTLLAKFEDNNLNAVDKTAAEVNAMYSATVGESAIKNDPSAAASMLSEIGDLLSGKKKAGSSSSKALSSLSLDFSADIGDIWGEGGGSSSFFGSGSVEDLSKLEGLELFNSANKQCLELTGGACENNAVLTMARSSYSILIGQDCNAYEKNVDAKKEQVLQIVRTAEKYLREARLDEYRSHNSADVNECISKVRTAVLADTACGTSYKKCLDPTGQYINPNTGEPLYTVRLLNLTSLIDLENASGDILQSNLEFNKFLDSRKMFATKALDTCRDTSDMVWTEFKRQAIIEIAQAQDEKIEQVKGSCITTMKECYDNISGQTAELDTTKGQATGAMQAYATKAVCKDKVVACANIYTPAGGQACEFDSKGKIINEDNCGLKSLLGLVNAVDNVKVAEGCATAIDGYVKQLCTPTSGTQKFPWNCRLKKQGGPNDNANGLPTESVSANIKQFALDNCSDPDLAKDQKTYDALPVQTRTQIDKSVSDVIEQMDYQMMEVCEKLDGYWQDSDETNGTLLTAFYSSVFGGKSGEVETSWGRCVQNDVMVRCLAYNTDDKAMATYDRAKDECTFTDIWFENQCALLGNGYYENSVCYMTPPIK